MQNVPHPPSSEQFRRTVADVFGDRDTTPTAAPQPDWPQAVAQVGDALCQKLRVATPTARLHKALEFVLAHAVTLHADGSASVLSGKQTYTLAPHCPCPDAKNRAELCKHVLAVELHRRALALLDGIAHAPAPTPSAPVAVAPTPSVPTSARWQVQEAPTSACFKWRVGTAELTYTFRGATDAEVLDRFRETLPLLQDILDACETRAAERTAARDAALAQAQAPQAPQAPAPTASGVPLRGRHRPHGMPPPSEADEKHSTARGLCGQGVGPRHARSYLAARGSGPAALVPRSAPWPAPPAALVLGCRLRRECRTHRLTKGNGGAKGQDAAVRTSEPLPVVAKAGAPSRSRPWPRSLARQCPAGRRPRALRALPRPAHRSCALPRWYAAFATKVCRP